MRDRPRLLHVDPQPPHRDRRPSGWPGCSIIGTIPVGIVGLVFEHSLRTIFAKPLAAAIFLTINGLILLAGERLRKRTRGPRARRRASAPHRCRARRRPRPRHARAARGLFIGSAQILALFAGISRSGVTMVAGLLRGLDHEDAARFSFMLATPVILAAGVYKLPDLLGHNGDQIRGQVLVGSLAAGVAAYLSVRFLTRYFETRTLMPFAIYCLVFGVSMILVLDPLTGPPALEKPCPPDREHHGRRVSAEGRGIVGATGARSSIPSGSARGHPRTVLLAARGAVLAVLDSDPHVVVQADTATYERPALALLEDGDFSRSPQDQRPEFLRTPGYPAFIATVYLIFGQSHAALLLMQVLLSTVTVLVVYLLGARCGRCRSACSPRP